MWDTSREDDPVIASSGMNDDAHREPVTRVDWVPDPSSKGKKYHVSTVLTVTRHTFCHVKVTVCYA